MPAIPSLVYQQPPIRACQPHLGILQAVTMRNIMDICGVKCFATTCFIPGEIINAIQILIIDSVFGSMLSMHVRMYIGIP